VKLLLAFLFAMVGLGLFSDRVGARTNALIAAAVVLTTVMYFGFQRFMTI
jgi:hypothetical protein